MESALQNTAYVKMQNDFYNISNLNYTGGLQ